MSYLVKPVRWIERLKVTSKDLADYDLCNQIGFEKYLAHHRGEEVRVGVADTPLVRVPSMMIEVDPDPLIIINPRALDKLRF